MMLLRLSMNRCVATSVRRTERSRLTEARKVHEQLVKEEESKKTESKTAPRFDPMYVREKQNLQAAIERLEVQIRTKDSQAQEYIREAAEADKQSRAYQARIESAPLGEQQYSMLIREKELARAKYEDLNRKKSSSAMADESQKRQLAETLEVIDQASLPQTPTEPKRSMIVLIGSGLGLVLGLFLAGAREAKDSSLKNLKDVRAYTQLTVLGTVPLLENDLVIRRRRRLSWLAWSTACLVGLMVMSGSVFYYFSNRV